MKHRQRGIWKCKARSFTIVAERSEAARAGIRARASDAARWPKQAGGSGESKALARPEKGEESSILRHSTSAGRLTGITDTREATAGGVATGKLRVDRGERPSYMCIVYTGVCRQ